MKAPGKRATKKVADHPPKLTVKVGLSASELRLAAEAARHQHWTTEEIVEEFLLDGTAKRPGETEQRGTPGGGASPGTKDWRISRGQTKGKT